MSVVYKPIDGEQVSAQWLTALTACRRAGVSFNVNEGHRTMAKQQYFWDLYRAGRGNLAARPSATAPHIRTGRFDHAIDFNNAAGVMAWLRKHGIRCSLTVPGESWHVEADAQDLAAYHARHAKPPRPLRRRSTGKRVQALQRRLRALGFKSVPAPGRRGHGHLGSATVSAVKRFQRSHHLKADGVVGASTTRALKRATS